LSGKSFDAAELWTAAERSAATRILIVGDAFARPMARALEANPGRWDLTSLRVISSSGLMWSDEVKAALVRMLADVALVDILGASEASGFGYSITTRHQAMPTGLFQPGASTVLIDRETERVLGPDEVGEGWLARSAPFAQGYYRDPVKTAATYRVIDGVLYAIPGDVAARDEQGRIRLIGRGSLCINTGGEKVFPEEVEEALRSSPGIEDALVVGVADPGWGKAVAALITVDASFDEGAVRAALKAKIAAYKIPRHLLVVDELPRQASGKADYRRADEMVAARLR
jgi:3-oxocholest-4-en-26-oate---CoA ligase